MMIKHLIFCTIIFGSGFRFHYDRFQNEDEAEDIAIRVFAKAFEKIQTYDETKSSFLTWVINISKNAQIDLYRKREKTKNNFKMPFLLRFFKFQITTPPQKTILLENKTFLTYLPI